MSTYFWATNVYLSATYTNEHRWHSHVFALFSFFRVYVYVPKCMYIFIYIYINNIEPRSRSPSSPRNYAISRSRLVGFDCSLDVSTELNNLAERRNDSCLSADIAINKQSTTTADDLSIEIWSIVSDRWKWRRCVHDRSRRWRHSFASPLMRLTSTRNDSW